MMHRELALPCLQGLLSFGFCPFTWSKSHANHNDGVTCGQQMLERGDPHVILTWPSHDPSFRLNIWCVVSLEILLASMAKLKNEKHWKAVQSHELYDLLFSSTNSKPCISGEQQEHDKKRAHHSKKSSQDWMISKPKGRPGRSRANGYNIREAMRVSGPQYNYFVVRSCCADDFS